MSLWMPCGTRLKVRVPPRSTACPDVRGDVAWLAAVCFFSIFAGVEIKIEIKTFYRFLKHAGALCESLELQRSMAIKKASAGTFLPCCTDLHLPI